MRKTRIIISVVLLTGVQFSRSANTAGNFQLEDLSLSQLEQRLADIDKELTQLASYSLLSGIGAVGFRTSYYDNSEHTEWIQIDWEKDTPIDEIVLVPSIWRDTKTGFHEDGFPAKFQIIAGKAGDEIGSVVASFSEQDALFPRIAPLVIPCPGIKAAWVRLKATQLSTRAWDEKYILQLSEIIVFSGQENVALGQSVSSSSPELVGGARGRQCLVDGFLPYMMDAYQGDQSVAFVSEPIDGADNFITIDLEAVYPLNRIHFHSVELGDTVPPSTPVGFGMPKRLLVIGAKNPDFSDATSLVEYSYKSVFETGPIIMRNFPVTECRYVRLVTVEPYVHDDGAQRVGFAEIELFSEGRNVAVGKPVSAQFRPSGTDRSLSAVTDGHNLYGEILPIRTWMNELARRHDLEWERPVVTAELTRRYLRQKAALRWTSGLAVSLAVAIIITVLIDRILRLRHVANIRHRFAADLHDEVGADLHTIGLLSDLAERAKDDPEELSMLHARIRRVTNRTGRAVRNCSNMMESDQLYSSSMREDMQRASQRIIVNLRHDISIEGEAFIEKLRQRTRVDLFLFFQECLINVSRHSGATEFITNLKADKKQVLMTIQDNGKGIPHSKHSKIPNSLQRRARLLGAKVTADYPINGGTQINLKLKTRKWGFPR